MAVVVTAALASIAPSAGASSTHPFLETFGSAQQPGFLVATSVAIDQSNGDLLFVEPEDATIRRFKPDGTPDNFSATGTNVISSTPEGPLEFPVAEERRRSSIQVAVDNSGGATQGNIYLATGTFSGSRIDVFSSTGAFLGKLDEYKEGADASGSLTTFSERACGVAVAPNGTVYAGDSGGYVHKYVPSGAFPTAADNTANFSYPEACTMAAGAGPTASFIFVDSYGGGSGELSKLDASSGEAKYVVATGVSTVSMDPSSGHVYAAIGKSFIEYDAAGAASASAVATVALGGTGRGVAIRASTGNVYLTREGETHVEVFGPTVVVPTVAIEPATAVTGNTATLNGKVNPEGIPLSECEFEYGPASFGAGFPNSVPCEQSIPTDSADHAVSANVSGLEANGIGYQFRLAAKNANGASTSAAETFSTAITIEVSAELATAVTGTEATLNGTLNPQGNAVTNCEFQYGLASESGFASSAPCEQSIPTDSADHAVSATITDLKGDGSQYKFRLLGANSFGSLASSTRSFNVDTTATAEPATGLTQSAATLNGTVKTDGQPLSDCELEYGTNSSFGQSVPCSPAAGSIPVDFADHTVSASVSGLQESTAYYFRVSTTSAGGAVHSSGQAFQTLGTPRISGESAIANQSSALIGGYLKPEGSETTYHFEWGTTSSYGNTAPAGPEPSAGAGADPVPVEAKLSGLEVGQAYHFRLVATNSFGTVQGPDETFTTYKPVGLPDNRRYEQVSPVDKGEYGVEPTISMAAVSGNRLLFQSKGTFAGQPTSLAVETTPYLATRGPDGWNTRGIALPNGSFGLFSNGYMGFTPDMSMGVIAWEETGRFGGYDPQAPSGTNSYLHDSESGSFQLLNGTLSGTSNDAGFVWGTPDFGKMAIETLRGLIPGTPCANVTAELGKECVYEWDHGALRLASILPGPGGEAVRGTVGSSTGFHCNFEHALSDDGSRLFFTSKEGETAGNIFVRENGVASSLVTASERGQGGMVPQEAWFQDAEAAHGNKVLFTTTTPLVNGDDNETRDLYMYDFTKPQGERLTLVSEDGNPEAPNGANVNPSGNSQHCGGLVAASEDLSRVYFVAENQIVAGAPTAPGPKLYLWQQDASPHTTYIGRLDQSDVEFVGVNAAPAVNDRNQGMPRQARWSADGRYLAFMSSARLTPFDNEGQKEIYRYDAVSGALDCVSCSSDAFPAEGSVYFKRKFDFGFVRPVNHEPQNVSNDGKVFFDTTRGLAPGDSNGVQDVYEYEDGQLHLISRGSGSKDSYFLDASSSGEDVFFTTEDQLVGWDDDQNSDAYDARVNGGLPEPPPPPSRCEGEACLPAPLAPNDPTPASSSFQGAGNVTEPPKAGRCAKGRVRRHGRCLKKKQAHKKQNRHGKSATRSHG